MDRKLNFEVAHFIDKGSAQIIFHSHDIYEIYLFISGNVTYYIEENRYDLIPGDILIIPPYQMHRPVFTNNNTYERLLLSLDPEFIQYLSDEKTPLLACFSAINESKNYLIHCNMEALKELTELLEKIISASESTAFGSRLLVNSLITQVLIYINRLHFSSRTKTDYSQYDSLISKVIAYINNNLCNHLTLEKICEEHYVSTGHLIREFKKYTNTTVYDYIITKRLSYAKMLIRDGHSLTYSCHASGFNDYSNYYKTFKSKLGMTPSEYKNIVSRL